MPIHKPKYFETRHIKIQIRPPTGKELDLDDEHDIKSGMEGIWTEWREIQEEVNAMFKVFSIDGTIKKDRYILP